MMDQRITYALLLVALASALIGWAAGSLWSWYRENRRTEFPLGAFASTALVTAFAAIPVARSGTVLFRSSPGIAIAVCVILLAILAIAVFLGFRYQNRQPSTWTN